MRKTQISLLTFIGVMFCFSQPVWSMADESEDLTGTPAVKERVKEELSIEEARLKVEEAKKALKEAKLSVARLEGKPEKETVKKRVRAQIEREIKAAEVKKAIAEKELEILSQKDVIEQIRAEITLAKNEETMAINARVTESEQIEKETRLAKCRLPEGIKRESTNWSIEVLQEQFEGLGGEYNSVIQKLITLKERKEKLSDLGKIIVIKSEEYSAARRRLDQFYNRKNELIRDIQDAINEGESARTELSVFDLHKKQYGRKVKELGIKNKKLVERRRKALRGDVEAQYELAKDLIKGGELKVDYFRSKLTEEEKQFSNSFKSYDIRQDKYGKTLKEKEGYSWLRKAAKNGHKEAPWELFSLFLQRKLEVVKNSREKAFGYMRDAVRKGDIRAHGWYLDEKRRPEGLKLTQAVEYGKFFLKDDELSKLKEDYDHWYENRLPSE